MQKLLHIVDNSFKTLFSLLLLFSANKFELLMEKLHK